MIYQGLYLFAAYLIIFGEAFTFSSSPEPFLDGVPRLSLQNLEAGYHGLVKENETVVEVTPTIRGVGAKICGFHIVNKHHGEAPFQIILKDNGEAELKARRVLNCEKRKNYKFDIAAVSCSGLQSENATVHITVMDINEFAPVFLEASYVCQVDEGRLYSEIVRVEATDRDCTPKFGDICKYEILTTDQPFTIDNEGTIRNTEPLDYERSHNHILSVVAYDCGMKQSQPVMVTVKVNRICKLGWKGIAERVDYVPSSGREDLFPAAQLKLCDMPCSVHSVQAKLSLATKHIDKGCDRDTYSVASQRKICGASADSIELLAPNTKGVSTDDGHESDQIFEFDGVSSAVSVSNDVLNHGLAPIFTIATWLKHKNHPNQDKHVKEHILCSADDHKMNRHHYAWFVRNCRLILLLRRDFSEGDLNIFRPAEWRWNLPQVCDDEWHHYAVSVQFPEVQLYVDGSLFKSEKKNPEVIDDWPLHPTKGINTTLTVGACWQGSENKMKHHLHGYLAGLSVLLNKVEKPSVLSCLHKCKESLDVPPMELLEPGMELLTNSDLTELSIEGDNKTNLEVLIKKIGYTNSRDFPTPGRRNLHLSTTITCDGGRTVKVPNVESYVMVLPPQQPSLVINGTANLASDYHDFREGVKVFTDVHVGVSPPGKSWKSTGDESAEKRLDSCVVTVYPSLNPDHETLTVPHNMITQFGITAKLSKDGATLIGSNIIYNYQQVLRQIQYTNRKPAYYLNRVFKLICSEMNGRFLSNEYVQTLTVIHPRARDHPPVGGALPGSLLVEEQATKIPVAHAQVAQHHVDVHPHAVIEHYERQPLVSATSHAVTIIMVVCVGFLVVMIVLGVVRIRAAHQRHAQEELNDAEMAWDDSALNITVNPMEEEGEEAGGRRSGEGDQDNDSSDDNSSYREDEELDSSDEEEHITVGKLKDLEWDNSTLA
ncbi:calsyntenin-1 [Halyomorpha halys]|uniref:calsyntenin-1 n=1 Tax=Halyomorpha halys TaxID=286706 RepID=UPI0006D517E2|nr:calsyntenin-1 [Halyomorpha halys]